jgi:hypothetical protein
MSRHAFSDPAIRSRLEPKGELVFLWNRNQQILLETATLQLLATVVDIGIRQGSTARKNSYFERITLELAIWPRQGSAFQLLKLFQ